MARDRRRVPSNSTSLPAPNGLHDEVDDFVSQRHKVMLEKVAEDDSANEDMGNEPEKNETNVLDIEMSDSDDDSSEEGDEHDDTEARKEREERMGFGSTKRDWYGGDTHEYEIMEDEEREEVLRDEEEEALRLQKEALSRMQPDDYYDEDEDEDDEQVQEKEGDGVSDKKDDMAADVLVAAAPEVPLLTAELVECYKQTQIWRERVEWGELARIIYHLHASFVNNAAFYLSLRTDPEAEGVSTRTHPVLARIVRIRDMLEKAMALPCTPPTKGANQPSGYLVVDKEVNDYGYGLETIHTGGENDRIVTAAANGVVPADDVEMHKRKERKRKRNEKKKQAKAKNTLLEAVEADDEVVQSLFKKSKNGQDSDADEQAKERKRRKLSKLVGAMERERTNRDVMHVASADADVVREDSKAKRMESLNPQTSVEPINMVIGKVDDDDEVMRKMLAKKTKKEAKKAKKEAENQPHVYTFKDNAKPDSRRKASSQVVKNRGLTRYRPKDKKTPRIKNRLAYSKAVVRRKGTVQEYIGKPGGCYSGEASGINMSVRKGSRLSNV